MSDFLFFFFSDAGVSGATSSQNLSHQQAQHQLGQAIHMPGGVTQYVTTMQRPHQVKPVSQNIINHFFIKNKNKQINLKLIIYNIRNSHIILIQCIKFKLIHLRKKKTKR